VINQIMLCRRLLASQITSKGIPATVQCNAAFMFTSWKERNIACTGSQTRLKSTRPPSKTPRSKRKPEEIEQGSSPPSRQKNTLNSFPAKATKDKVPTSGTESTQGKHHDAFAPRIYVVGVGGAGGNALNNMIAQKLAGVDFVALNTDAQHLSTSLTENRLQIGLQLTNGLGCGANPDAGRQAAEESSEQILEHLHDAHMVFVTAGMGGGTGTGAAPVVAELCYNANILTVAVVTKPFLFEGAHRMRIAEEGLERLRDVVDTLIVIPNQNIFALADENTTFKESFTLADDVLLDGVKSITDLMTSAGSINLDFADVQTIMHGMGSGVLGTGESSGTDRAVEAAVQALSNPLLSHMDVGTAKGLLVNVTGGDDMTLFEVEKAVQKVTECVEDPNANIIFGSSHDSKMEGSIRVSVVATGIEENDQISQ